MESECLTTDGARDKDGYSRCFYEGRNDVKHRAVWKATNGPIPTGLVVRHKCDNAPCHNIAHLELGTVADNNRDRALRNQESWYRSRGESNIKAKLTREKVAAIRASLAKNADLARLYGIGKSAISDIRLGKTWNYPTAVC